MIAALAAQFQASVSLAIGLGRDVGLTVVNFFSFFTVLTNLGAAVVLASIAWTSVQRPGTLTRTAGLVGVRHHGDAGVRGPLAINPVTGRPPWYPYPFLNPAVSGGRVGVLAYVVGIAVTFAALGAGVIVVTRRRFAE